MRKQARRSFTVEIKHGLTSGRSFIPPKQPRPSRKGKALADSPAPADLAVSVWPETAPARPDATEPRRVLPSLVTWAPPPPEPEFEPQPEAPLPRVRRVAQVLGPDGAPRRRGRPRKIVPEAIVPEIILPETVASEAGPARSESPAPARPILTHPMPARAPSGALARSPRVPRADVAALPRSERWKRRLPRACW